MFIILPGVLVFGIVTFLLSLYHFIKLQSFIKSKKRLWAVNLVPLLLLSSGSYTADGQVHFEKFAQYLVCAAFAIGLLLIVTEFQLI